MYSLQHIFSMYYVFSFKNLIRKTEPHSEFVTDTWTTTKKNTICDWTHRFTINSHDPIKSNKYSVCTYFILYFIFKNYVF